MASISGLRGDAGWAAYNTTKSAVIILTQCLAWEVGSRGIRVNAVCSGPIATADNMKEIDEDMARAYANVCAIPRMGTAEEVAGAMPYLASDDASYVTGAALVVDGGLTARTRPAGLSLTSLARSTAGAGPPQPNAHRSSGPAPSRTRRRLAR